VGAPARGAGYEIYTLVEHTRPFGWGNAFGGAFLVLAIAQIVLRWTVVAGAFALLFPVLPGSVGPVKGLVVAGIVGVPWAVAAPLVGGTGGSGGWPFAIAELALVLVVLGLVLDHRSVVAARMQPRQLLDLYRVTSVRAGLAYLSPLLVLVAAVIQQLLAGDAGSAVGNLVRNASSLLPGSGR
jgi:hypothetical protein